MLFRSRGGGGVGGSSEETGERQRNREQMRSPLADRNERNVTGHFISKTTGKEEGAMKDESEKERREREFAGVKKKQNEGKKTTSKTTTASVSVCPDIIREYRETTSTRSLTENEIQINSRDELNLGEEEEALKTKISTSTRTKNSYKKMKLLGKGGFAIVYSVKDLNKKPSDDGVVESQSSYNYYAAKVVSKKNLERQKQKDKMLAEIRIHRASEHEFIVKFKKCFEDEMNVYILMEKCSDRTLADVIKYRGAITETETSAYVWEISQAMQYLHEKLVVHRDLKLGNVFLTDYGLKEASAMADESERVLRRFQTGEERLKAFERMERSFLLESGSSSSSNHHHSRQPRIKIGDFGLAVQLAHKREKKFTVCGTPNYIAPEVLAGSQGPGHNSASDIWSLGVIIYALLCGEPPFQTESVEATYNRIRKTDFGFPDDRQCLKVLSSEHLLMNVTTTTAKKNNNNINSDENNKNSTKNENVPNLPKYRFPISATSRDLVKRCLLAEAEKRLTGVEILEHPFFDVVWAAANNHQTAIETKTIETTRMTEYDNRNRNIIIADAMTTSSTTPRRAASVPPLVSSSNKAHQNQSPMHSALESISGLRQMEAETKHALQQHQHALNGQKSWTRRTRSATMDGSTTTTTERENIESARVALAQISVNAGNGGAQTATTSPPITMTSFARTNDQIRSSGLSTSSSANNNNDNYHMPLSARIKVKHFTNQTEQWGLGYALTDNSFGAIFNDESRAVLTKCGKCVFYWPNNVSATSSAHHSSSAEKRISPRKKFSSKMCIAVPLRHAQNGNAGDDHFNRDLAKKTAILLRFKEILLRKEEEFSRGCNDENENENENENDTTTTTTTEKRKKVEKENLQLDPHDPNYYYDKNPLFDISKSISLLLDRGAMINYWRTGRSNATTFTFNDGSFQTLFGDANSTSVFCCDDYSHQHHSSNTNLRGDAYYGGVLLGGGQGVTKRRLAVCEQRKIVLKNLSKVPVSNTSRLSSVSNSPASPSPLGKMKTSSGVSSSSATIRAKVLDAREILSKSARSDTNLEKCVRYCHESGTRLEMQNNNNYNNV
ncbi:unnamed protein product [Bathycoccus prasinos]